MSITKGQCFKSYQELEEAHFRYCDETFQPLFYKKQARTVENYMRAKNIRIPPELVYQSVGFVCEHFGENTRAKKSF